MTFVHCGGSSSKSNDNIVSVPPSIEFSLRPPEEYYVEDPDCSTSKDAATTIAKANVFSFGLRSSEVSLTEVKSKDSLESPVVEETQYGLEFIRSCDFATFPGRQCLSESGVPQPWENSFARGGLLKVCKDGFSYNRQSFEGVGLTAIYYLGRAFERFIEMSDEKDFEIEKIRLLILPVFKTVFDNYEDPTTATKGKRIEYVTHNAGYFPKTEGANPIPIIAVFPETACLTSKVNGYLWESSFVLAHEFSHHIEKSYFAKFFNLEKNESINDLTQHIFAPHWNRLNENSFETDPVLYKISETISEGFADLIGYYSDYATGESILAIDGFGFNRMVGYGAFKNTVPKVLSKDVVDLFMNSSSNNFVSSNNSFTHLNEIDAECDLPSEDPNFQDSHTIGAILAHTLDSTFKIISAWEENQKDNEPSFNKSDIKSRLLLAVAWIKKVREKRAAFFSADKSDGKQYFQIMSDGLEEVLIDYFKDRASEENKNKTIGDVKKAICQEISSSLPAIDSPPFSKQYPNCK